MRKTLAGDLDVACPLCKAERGEMCINIGHSTRFQGEVHRERRLAAEVALDETCGRRHNSNFNCGRPGCWGPTNGV